MRKRRSDLLYDLGRRLIACSSLLEFCDLAFEDVRRLFRATAAIHIAGMEVPSWRPRRIMQVGLGPEMILRHLEWLKEDPSRPDQIAGFNLGEDRILTPAIVARRLRSRKRYASNVLGSSDLSPLGAVLVNGDRSENIFGVFRPADNPFDASDIKQFRDLLPFLSAAICKVEALDQLRESSYIVDILADESGLDIVITFDASLRALSVRPIEHWLVRNLLSRDGELLEHVQAARHLKRQIQLLFDSPTRERLEVALPIAADPLTGTRTRAMLRRVMTDFGPRAVVGLAQPGRRKPAVILASAGLSAAEVAVTQYALVGIANREIAERRSVSLSTVGKQLSSAYAKLGVSSRAELAAICRRDATVGSHLTRRQRDIVTALEAGLTVPEIAERYGVAPATVIGHIHRLRKGGVLPKSSDPVSD